MITRRGLIRSLIAAPFVVKISSLMPVRLFIAASGLGDRLTYSAIGIREDLWDVIYQISPLDMPSRSLEDSLSVLHEWQRDSLSAASFV